MHQNNRRSVRAMSVRVSTTLDHCQLPTTDDQLAPVNPWPRTSSSSAPARPPGRPPSTPPAPTSTRSSSRATRTTTRTRQNGTLPLGQLALTTEVENFPSWPAGDTRQYLKTALKADDPDFPYWVTADKPQPTHGINGPELIALMRQQAVNFGTRIESKDIVKVDLKKQPFTLTTHDGADGRGAHASSSPPGRGRTTSGCRARTSSRTAASRPVPSATGRCRASATSRSWSSAAATRRSRKATYLTKFASTVHLLVRRDVLRASKIMQERAHDEPEDRDARGTPRSTRCSATTRSGVTGVRLKNNKTGATDELPASRAVPGDRPHAEHGFLDGQVETDDDGLHQVDDARRGRTRAWRACSPPATWPTTTTSRRSRAAGTGCMAALDAERYLGHHGLI